MSYQIKRSFQYGIGFLTIALMYAQHARAQHFTQYQAARINLEVSFSPYDLGWDEIVSADISNSGTVAVSTDNGDYIYKNGTTTRINIADHYWSEAIHINNNDQVSGQATTWREAPPPRFLEFNYINYFYDNGSIQDIGSVRPISINDNGQIIGQQGSGFVSYLNGTVSSLALPYGTTAVNLTNNAAGTDTNGKLFTYINGEKQVFNYPAGIESGAIFAFNDNNQAVGGLGEARKMQAFLLDNDTITMLGRLDGRKYSYANDINSSGIIVGRADDSLGIDRYQHYLENAAAFIINDGAMTNLNWLLTPQDVQKGIRLTSAVAINDSNFIVARGYDNTNYREGLYLLTPNPVPLPASVWMFLSGLGCFGALRRLSRKA